MTEQTPHEPIEFQQLVDDYAYGKLVEYRVFEGHVAQNTMRGELADEIASFAFYCHEKALRARPTLDRERVLEVLGNTLTEVFNCCSGYMRPSEGHDVFPPCATWRQRTTIADAIIAEIKNDL